MARGACNGGIKHEGDGRLRREIEGSGGYTEGLCDVRDVKRLKKVNGERNIER